MRPGWNLEARHAGGLGPFGRAVAVMVLAAAPVLADSAELHNTTGLTYYYQSKDAEAFAEFVKALEKDPSYAQPHFNLGRLFERQKRYEEAHKQYREALQLDPTVTAAREGAERMEAALAAQGRPPGGQLVPAGGLTPDAQKDQIEAIRTLLARGETAEARSRLEVLARINPDGADVLSLQAELADRAGDHPRAIALLTRLKTVQPGTASISYRLAQSLFRLGSFEKAQAEVERAIQLNPGLAELYHLLGLIQQSRGKPSEAFNAFREAGRLNPADLAARNQADRISGQLGLYHYNAGLFYFQQQAWAKARESLRKAIEKGNLNPEQMAIAQQYLVIAEFSSAKVAEQIRSIQAERALVERGHVEKRVLVPEAESKPASFPEGRYVDFLGWIVARKDGADTSEIIVTKNFREVEVREEGGDGAWTVHRQGHRRGPRRPDLPG